MNLTEFIRTNDIQCKDGEAFSHSPEFFKMKEFERTRHVVCAVPFLEPETYKIREFDVALVGFIDEKWDKQQKKTKRETVLTLQGTFSCYFSPDPPSGCM